jgi:hypothetical protein
MYAVQFYPPGRDDSFIFDCADPPVFGERNGVLVVTFTPRNGTPKGKPVTAVASSCLIGEGEYGPHSVAV